MPHNALKLFFTRPLYAPLLFPNDTSDARDHAANERTFLSYLRLAVYLAVVSVAVFINFHLKHTPSSIEVRISRPLGFVFWLLAVACLGAGFANYIKTVAKYARRAALVQSGMKTQIVFGVVSCAIIAACGVLIAADAQKTQIHGKSLAGISHSHGEDVVVPTINHVGGGRNAVTFSPQNELLKFLGEAAGRGLIGNS